MVDAAASFQSIPNARPNVAASRSAVAQDVTVNVGTDLAAYVEVARNGLFAPAQSPLWIESWIDRLRPDFVVATLLRAGQPALSIALEVVRTGPLRRAGFMSGSHANGNMPPMTAAFASTASAAELKTLIAGIGKARPDIDVVSLDRLAGEIGGIANPLLLLSQRQSPNLSLAVSLDGGFDAMLGRVSGKRKRKKHRSQTRKFEAAGGFRRIEAKTEADARRLLDAFFAMKEARFRKMGIANVFAQPEVREFFHAIFARALEQARPPFALHGLEVGGKIRAVTGSSRCAERLICEFGAIADDEVAFASPGEFLFFDNIKEACDDGFAVYDFSVGDEPYKRLWCDLEIRQFDVLMPLTIKGQALAAALQATNSLKAFVKNNRFVWRLVKRLRKKAAAQADPEED